MVGRSSKQAQTVTNDHLAKPSSPMPGVRLRYAAGPSDMAQVRRLFLAYGESLGFSSCFHGFGDELSSLPGDYAPPSGRLLLAEVESRAVGVVALRPLGEAGVCEIKRLYVDPDARGTGLGRRLTEAIVSEARKLSCRALRLETLAEMMAANVVYDDLGFEVVVSGQGAAPEIITKELRL